MTAAELKSALDRLDYLLAVYGGIHCGKIEENEIEEQIKLIEQLENFLNDDEVSE